MGKNSLYGANCSKSVCVKKFSLKKECVAQYGIDGVERKGEDADALGGKEGGGAERKGGEEDALRMLKKVGEREGEVIAADS